MKKDCIGLLKLLKFILECGIGIGDGDVVDEKLREDGR
jgi:hypothetical protein